MTAAAWLGSPKSAWGDVTGELLTGRLTRQPEGSGPGRGGVGHAFVPALSAAAGEGVEAISGSMEGDHADRVVESGLGGSSEAGDCPQDANELGMERGEAAGHPGPAGHPRDTNPLIRLRVAGEEPADQDSEILDVPLEVPFKPGSAGPGALGEGHHGHDEQSLAIELSRACLSGEEPLPCRLSTMNDAAPDGSARRNRRT